MSFGFIVKAITILITLIDQLQNKINWFLVETKRNGTFCVVNEGAAVLFWIAIKVNSTTRALRGLER